MISESIKTLLGEDLAKQVEEAVKGKGKEGKDVDLVVGNDGTFVPAEKHEGEKQRAASAENALRAAAEAVKALGGTGDPAKLGEDAAKAKEVIDALKGEHKTEMDKIKKNTALRMALADKAHDPDDIISRLDLESIQVGEGGELKTDLEPLLEPIRGSKPYLFLEEEPSQAPPLKGAKPAAPAGGEPPKEYTTEELGKLPMEEYRAYREKHGGFPKN